jgi:hypothetical protein
MKRILLLVTAALVMATMVIVSALPAIAAPGGNAANAAKCEEGGYLDYTDANGNPFKNEGQCTRYAAKGGQLVPTANISLDPVSGTISGTGFTPNSRFDLKFGYSPNGGGINFLGFSSTDATGAFVLGPGVDFCEPSGFPTGITGDQLLQVTVTDSAGVHATEFAEISCGT